MKDTDFLITYKYAHRGLFDNNNQIPENSLKSFKEAINQGFAIELDIQTISDGTYVCFHDKNLKRMANIDKNISELNNDDLSKINLLDSNETIPLFTDVLNLVNSKVPLLIEIKTHPNFKKAMLNLIKILDNYNGEFAVFSFDYRIVKWFKKHRPNYIRGQITSYFNENKKMPRILKYLMKTLFFNKFTKPDFISYNIDNLPNKYANRFKEKDLIVFGYTARNQEQFDKIDSLYDNVVFEGFIPKK